MSAAGRRVLSSATRWKIRSARFLAQSAVPRPLRSQAVHLSYYNGRNFGDQLSPRVVEFVLGAPVVEAHFAGADLSAIGSILDPLERWRNPYNPVVWGSGFLREGGRWRGRDIRPVAVRGTLSRERVAHLADSVVALGDPGLLVRRMYPQLMAIPKRYRVSLVPHISEAWHDGVARARVDVPDLHVIDVRADPRRVLEEIAASEIVLSSSLHGLICADALDVPNRWVPISGDLGGGDYKFADYYSVFGQQPEPLHLAEALDAAPALAAAWTPRQGLDSILDALIASFPAEDLAALYRR
ncbi:polysaccharide pyruvyl transferase family protein [Micrococcus luteus]|nr:polysaccharide pyruvyl transferase family protein [Micrococcus luteus]